MSHTALRLYSDYFDKHVAICGHGPIKDIARNIGFKKVSTIEDVSAAFPWLDACKPKQQLFSVRFPKYVFILKNHFCTYSLYIPCCISFLAI